jgi:hypothetical protein
MNSRFKKETGAIIDYAKNILYLKEGGIGHVEFPSELIADIHKAAPGKLWGITHVHPPHVPDMSSRDELTLITWAKHVHPFPFHMQVISETNKNYFTITTWRAQLEAKEDWIERGKEGVRKVSIEKVRRTLNAYYSLELPFSNDYFFPLLLKSYDTI